MTLSPIVKDVRLEQPLNTELLSSPILIHFSALNITEVSPEQPSKADSLIEVTELGMIVLLQPTINLFVDVSIIALQLLRESYALLSLLTITEVRPEQLEKTLSPMELTEFGMDTEVSPEQP